jgi:hypothetical protein
MHRYPPWGEGREADKMYNKLLAEDCDLLIATPEFGSRTSDRPLRPAVVSESGEVQDPWQEHLLAAT